MKAAICYEYGQPLVIEEVTLDAPKEGEVRVKIAATGICHSDLHLISGEWRDRQGPPVIAGHESSGTVLDVGPGVTAYAPGERVIVTLIRSCGRCFYCTAGYPQRCETVFPLDRESRLHNQQGQMIRQGLRTGSFAQEVVVDESQLVKMPDDMAFDVAALLACGVITGAGAVLNTAQVKAGSSVVVIGTGGVGLNSIQAARIAGAYPIVAVDILDNKLEMAHQFGATHSVNPKTQDAIAFVRGLTAGRGADYVFVTVGNAKASEQGFAMLRPRGLQVIVGIPETGATAALPVGAFVQERMVTGSTMGSTRLGTDVPRLIARTIVTTARSVSRITRQGWLPQPPAASRGAR
ncbi:MAG: alcohol dehydrogenase catalytic domain-containing protein [Chloroflexi bacterium]|nr:alcohol dehydrogenase catalytic domain-containing protein [Chloroflexota bacterium]